MLTVPFLKANLQAQIAPNDDQNFLRLLQEADSRLLEAGKWRWCRTRTQLTPTDGYIVLPSTFAAILGAQVGNDDVGHFASDIRDEAFEFAPGGVGDVKVDGGPITLLIDQGLNDDGLRFYKITGHLVDDVAVNCLVHYAPAYLYDPDMDESDLPVDATTTTRCPNMAALKLMMFGIIFEESNDLGNSRQYVSTAMKRLDDLEKTQRGSSRQMVNTRANGVGQRRIRSYR